jgi:hypothetical protein
VQIKDKILPYITWDDTKIGFDNGFNNGRKSYQYIPCKLLIKFGLVKDEIKKTFTTYNIIENSAQILTMNKLFGDLKQLPIIGNTLIDCHSYGDKNPLEVVNLSEFCFKKFDKNEKPFFLKNLKSVSNF